MDRHKLRRWEEAEAVFRVLLAHLKRIPSPSVGYQVECKYWLAVALGKQRRIQAASLLTRQALTQSSLRNAALELDGPFENFAQIRFQIEGLNRRFNTASGKKAQAHRSAAAKETPDAKINS